MLGAKPREQWLVIRQCRRIEIGERREALFQRSLALDQPERYLEYQQRTRTQSPHCRFMQGIGQDERTVKIDGERGLGQWAVLVGAATHAALDGSGKYFQCLANPSPVRIVNQPPVRKERL